MKKKSTKTTCAKRISLSFALASVLCTGAFSQNMSLENFHYRDYLDLGQNKGVFSNTSGEVVLKAKDGSEFKFARVPNQAARTIDGSITSLGRNNVVTAVHIKRLFLANSFMHNSSGNEKTTFGQTSYKFLHGANGVEATLKYYAGETMYLKTTKYIVEGEVSAFNPENVSSLERFNSYAEALPEIEKIGDYLKKLDTDADGKLILYQAGSGDLKLHNNSNALSVLEPNTAKGGSLFQIGASTSPINFSRIINKDLSEDYQKSGLMLSAEVNGAFKNNTTNGDSGSGFYLYDTIKDEWVLVGVLRGHAAGGGNFINISYVNANDLNDYKTAYETDVTGTNLVANKDNIINADKSINLSSDLNLGYGGIVVESGATAINGTGSLKFAGFDIAENASVNLNTRVVEDLHKIGAGTLNVGAATGTNLRLGNGLVVLNAENAFNKIYVTSGRATLKLADNITNFNADNLFFGNGGGKLDLNGKSIVAKNISANDAGANIINSSSTTTANLTLQGNDNADTIVHTTIGGSDKNKINIAIQNTNDKTLVFNANTQIDGTLSVANSKVAIHGHPTTHAVKTRDTSTATIKQYDKNMPEYMDLERPSTLTQPDWDKVKFISNGVTLQDSTLSIGKESEFNSNITANDTSAINFGGDIDYFIDKLDGANTQNGGLSYAQQIESQKLDEKNQGNDTIKFSGAITASDTTAIKSSLTEFAPTLTLSGSATLTAKNLTLNENNSVNFSDNSVVQIEDLAFKNIANANNKIQKSTTATLNVSKSITLDNARGLDLNNGLVSNLDELNLIAKNGSSVTSSSTTTLKGISLDRSIYKQQGTDALSINGGNIELQNSSELEAKNLTLVNFTNDKFKISEDSTFGVQNLNADNSKIDLSNIKNASALQSVTAQNNSQITLKTWEENAFHNLQTHDSSKINFKELRFDMSTPKNITQNIGILSSLTLNNVGFLDGNEIKVNALNFNQISFADVLKIKLNFSDVLKANTDKIDFEKNYEIITATTLTGTKTPYVEFSSGVFATSTIENNKLIVKFQKEDPKSQKALENLSNNQSNELLAAILAHTANGASPELVAQIEHAAYTKDANALSKILEKTENELKNIGENSGVNIASGVLFSSNLAMNSRLAHIKFSPKLTTQNAFKYALASGNSSQDDLKNVLEAIQNDRAKNSFWYNFGGGYFKENSGADMKFYGTNIGYDKTADLASGSVIYGVMAGFTSAKHDGKNYQDRSKAYNIGIYADYEGASGHEFQSNLNLAYIKSEKDFTLLNRAENGKNNGFGALLSTYYKHRFDVSDKASLKPLVLFEIDYTKMDGFKTQNYKQDKLNEFGVSAGLGAEYSVVSQTQAHTIQAVVKKQIHRSNDDVKLNLSRANNYLEYDIKKSRIKYELNYIGETKLNENFTIQYNLGGVSDFKGGYGGRAGIKLEYKF
ncbi:autotransporter domain-containing protein [Campylobacter sp. RM6883]|nr:S6 family peptidase [Campylobacter sp. RM6914]MBE2984768.1 autotransporter domain-containing protein [Campylobacter sp. RM6883]QCD50574.1 peptidase, S6 family [Campylobacter sp. RM6914]